MTTKKNDLERLPTVVIENVDPCIDGGRYPIKRVIGQELKVSADIFKDGHEQTSAILKWRKATDADWNWTPMSPTENDRWTGVCHFIENAPHEYTIEAWEDHFKSWQVEYGKNMAQVIRTFEPNSMKVQFWWYRPPSVPHVRRTKSAWRFSPNN